jgi:hypothetical protein
MIIEHDCWAGTVPATDTKTTNRQMVERIGIQI